MRALVAGDEGRMLRWELTAHEERSTRSLMAVATCAADMRDLWFQAEGMNAQRQSAAKTAVRGHRLAPEQPAG